MTTSSIEDPAATAALQEIVDIYQQTNDEEESIEKPLSGADVVEAIGLWRERNHGLLERLGILENSPSSDG